MNSSKRRAGVLSVSPDLAEAVHVAGGTKETQHVSVERQQDLQTADVASRPLQTNKHYVVNVCCLLEKNIMS